MLKTNKTQNERAFLGNGNMSVVKRALVYGAETSALKKAHENRVDVVEMRMMRWNVLGYKARLYNNERIMEQRKWGNLK